MGRYESKSLAVNPKQAARFEEAAQKMGVPVEYDRKTGRCKGSADALEFEAARRGFYNTRGTNDKALKMYEEYARQRGAR